MAKTEKSVFCGTTTNIAVRHWILPRFCTLALLGAIAATILPVLVPHALAAEPAASWKMECDTRIPLRDPRGRIIGSTLVSAGTMVERLPAIRANAGKEVLRLRHMGETFEVPTDAELQAVLQKQNPAGTAAEKRVLDVGNWMRDQRIASGKAPAGPGSTAEELPPNYTTEVLKMEIPATEFTEIPKDFAWDKTVIIPGKFGFLKLPFIKQTKPGICVAAASINAVCHLHPEIQLKGSELFRLYNNRAGGASGHEALFGNLQLGVKCRRVMIGGQRTELVRKIQQSIEANLPVLAADVRHMVLIYGFNKESRKLFVWNQWGNGKIVEGMPKGTYLLKESDLPIEFKELMFIEKVRFNPVESLTQALEAKVGATEDLQVHPIVGSPFGDLQTYMTYSTPQRIKAALRAGRTILLQQGADVLCVFPNEVKTDTDMLECKSFPSSKTTRHSLQSLTQLMAANRGEFYSVKHAAKLPTQISDSTPANKPPQG